MKDSPESNSYSRLRDYGAFRESLAKLNKQRLVTTISNSDQSNALEEYAQTLSPGLDEMVTRTMPILALDEMVTRTMPIPALDEMVTRTMPIPALDDNHVSQKLSRRIDNTTIIQFPVSDQKFVGERTPSDPPLQSESQNPVALDSVKKKKKISVIFRVGVTLLIFILLSKSISWTALLHALTHVTYGKLLLGLIIGAFSIVISAYQWRSLLRAEHIHYDLAELIDLYLVGIAFSHFLPTGMGGDVVKAIHVGRSSNNNAGSASAVFMSRVTGFFGMLLIAMPVLLIWHSGFSSSVIVWFLLLSLLVGGMICGTIVVAALLPKFARGKWAKHRIMTSASKIGNALQASAKRPRALFLAILIGASFWLIGGLNYYAFGLALGIHIHLYFYFVAIPFISLVTFLPISINGFGIREGAFVFIFSVAHVATTSALLLALFMDAQILLFGIVGGIIYLTMEKKTNMKKVSQQRIA